MFFATLTLAFLILGAVALALIDLALSPENAHFPCVSPSVRWIMRLYAVAIFNRAAVLFVALYVKHLTHTVHWDVFFGSMGMCAAHSAFLYKLIKVRLPHGVWARLQRQTERRARAVGVR